MERPGFRTSETPEMRVISLNDLNTMKTTLFARPNLKLLMVAAAMIVLVQHLISAADTPNILVAQLENPTEADVEALVAISLDYPTSASYTMVSEAYRLRGETHQALHYLKKATLAREIHE